VFVSHFPRFSVFSPYSRSYSVFSPFAYFSVFFYQIPGPTVCFSQFARLSVFLAIFQDIHFSSLIFHVIQFSATFQVIECFFLILQVFQFPRHNPGTTVCIFHFSRYSPCFDIFQVLLCVFLIFHDFKFSWLTPVLQCAFLIYHVFPCFVPHTRSNNVCVSFSTFFQCSCHYPCSRMCISHFSGLWLFLTIFQVIQCLCLILQLLTFSRNNTSPTLCISRF
jgi:hypothetical protein